jgi:hypothetical protein
MLQVDRGIMKAYEPVMRRSSELFAQFEGAHDRLKRLAADPKLQYLAISVGELQERREFEASFLGVRLLFELRTALTNERVLVGRVDAYEVSRHREPAEVLVETIRLKATGDTDCPFTTQPDETARFDDYLIDIVLCVAEKVLKARHQAMQA